MADNILKNPRATERGQMTAAVMFQVVPKRWRNSFGLRPYIKDLSKPIYWSTPKNRREIRTGQRAYLWRSDSDFGPRGIVAIGEVVETPRLSGFRHPERVHSDGDEGAESSNWKTGIRLTEVRWNDGMLTAEDLADIVPTLTVLMNALGTVFRISVDQFQQIERLWARHR